MILCLIHNESIKLCFAQAVADKLRQKLGQFLLVKTATFRTAEGTS